ncbi:MAG TPA: 2OG-Fe(II) oxygenase [Thermoanaerobaculia bacterium]
MEVSNSVQEPRFLLPIVMDQLLEPDKCKEIIEIADRYTPEHGRVGNEVNAYRKTVVRRMERDDHSAPLWDRLYDLVQEINARHFGLDITGILPPECTTYVPGYGHFGWHTDINYKAPDLVRKLSVIIQLSSPADYEGGELQVFNGEPTALDKRHGAIVAFPAFVQHRVTPVTQGMRTSLVVFSQGPAWR